MEVAGGAGKLAADNKSPPLIGSEWRRLLVDTAGTGSQREGPQ